MRNNMRAERIRSNLTLEQVGERIGAHPNAVYRWEHGKAEPTASNLMALCNLYGCTPEYLLDMTADKHEATIAD